MTAALSTLEAETSVKQNSFGDEIIRGLYLSPFAAHQEWLLKRITDAADSGDLNAVVVDMKDDFGLLRYSSNNHIARSLGAIRPIFDVDSLLRRMHDHDIRVIARLVCFKDDHACNHSNFGVVHGRGGVWADEGGAHWLNAFNEHTWYYLLDIAKELEFLGFDEIQLDYVRFPTDGDVQNCVFSDRRGRIKEQAIEGFLAVMYDSLSIPLSVDVFGYAAWRTLKLEGQELARIGSNVDYICPMLYPSHFSPDFLKGEHKREYWVYYNSVRSAYDLLGDSRARVVTYVQGFSWRAPRFGAEYIFNQMLGSLHAGADGFFVWHAGGKYYPETFTALGWGGSSLRRKVVPSPPEIRRKSTQSPVTDVPISKTRIRTLFLRLAHPNLLRDSRKDSLP